MTFFVPPDRCRFRRALKRVVAALLLMASGAALPALGSDDPEIEHINPPELPTLEHSSQVTTVKNARKFLHIAGQTAVNLKFEVVGKTIDAQTDEALRNMDLALHAGGARRQDIVHLNVFFVDSETAAGKIVTAKIRDYFKSMKLPAATFVGVPKLVGEGLLVEIEGLAVVRNQGAGKN